MDPRPDFGENTYKGHDKLKGKVSAAFLLFSVEDLLATHLLEFE